VHAALLLLLLLMAQLLWSCAAGCVGMDCLDKHATWAGNMNHQM
jgi:hypothetical protein